MIKSKVSEIHSFFIFQTEQNQENEKENERERKWNKQSEEE